MGLFRFTAEKRKPASTGFSANALMLFFDGRHRNLMPYLKRLREYPGGAESAKALAESWKTEYKRRPAMMDELKKSRILIPKTHNNSARICIADTVIVLVL